MWTCPIHEIYSGPKKLHYRKIIMKISCCRAAILKCKFFFAWPIPGCIRSRPHSNIVRSSQIFTYRVVYTLHVSAIEISWAAVWAVTHPDVGDAVVLAPVSEDLRADVHVRHHLARPLHDHHLDEPALVEVSVETAVPLRVDCLLALHVLHADVCKRRESVRTCSVSHVAGLPCWKSIWWLETTQ